jgi:hypothetical protein
MITGSMPESGTDVVKRCRCTCIHVNWSRFTYERRDDGAAEGQRVVGFEAIALGHRFIFGKTGRSWLIAASIDFGRRDLLH